MTVVKWCGDGRGEIGTSGGASEVVVTRAVTALKWW